MDHNHPRTGKGYKSRHAHEVGARSAQAKAVGDRTAASAPVDPSYAVPDGDDPF